METDALIGRDIGPYRVLEKVGQGGMAEVYKGYHAALERYVAIKMLGRSLRSDPALAQRFQREAQAIASLRHPNIIQVFDFGDIDGGHYIVMEFVEGIDLRAEMDRRRAAGQPFSPDEIVHILRQVADALDYAHGRDIVHRDVKPANILLAPDGAVILTDFGLAMLRNRVSQMTMGHTFGTPEYIAPEQAVDSRAAVPQSDLYALGAILYEMITGHPPFEDESPLSLALKHINEEPIPPRRYAPTLPEAVEALVLRALAKMPQERFASGQAMIEALRLAWSAGTTPPGSKESPPPPPPPPHQPTPPAAAVRPAAPPPTSAPPPAAAPPSAPPAAAPAAPIPLWKRGWIIATVLVACVLAAIGIFAVLRSAGVALPVAAPTPTSTAPAAAVATATPTTTRTATPLPTAAPTPPRPTATATPRPSPVAPTETSAPPPATQTAPPPTTLPATAPTPGERAVRPLDNARLRFGPGGTFLMGAADDSEAAPHEQPQHPVLLNPFWIDETEVTNTQYRLCVEAGVCQPPKDLEAYDDAQRADHPVVYVTWQMAYDYCAWLDAHSELLIYLPTEAQWEMAASWDPLTHTQRRYPWGEADPDRTLLNYSGSGLNHTTAVGSYPAGASPYGVLDMAGNVWEWTNDWYGPNYYDEPDLPPNPTGPDSGSQHVMRGGSYGYGARQARSTHRDAGTEQASGAGLGFRCVVAGEQLPSDWR